MIYLGTFSFSYVTNKEHENWFGSFQIIVECDSPEQAENKFKSIIKKKRKKGEMFNEVRDIYLDVFHELKKAPKNGMLVNYECRRGEEVASTCCSTVDSSRGVKAYGYHPDGTEPPGHESGDSYTHYPFVSFESW